MSRAYFSIFLTTIALALASCAAPTSGGGEDPAENAATTGGNGGGSAAETTREATKADASTMEGREDRDDASRDRPGDGRRSGGRSGGGGREIQSAVLEITGESGSAFSGACTIGERRVEVEGKVPESFDLELDGKPLVCKIESTGPGALEADLSVGNSHYVQRTSGRGSTLNFSLSGDGYSSSTSSVSAVEADTPDAVSNASSYVEAGPSDD